MSIELLSFNSETNTIVVTLDTDFQLTHHMAEYIGDFVQDNKLGDYVELAQILWGIAQRGLLTHQCEWNGHTLVVTVEDNPEELALASFVTKGRTQS